MPLFLPLLTACPGCLEAGSVLQLGRGVPGLCGSHQVSACIWAFGTGDLEKGEKGGCQEEILAEQGLVGTWPLLWSINPIWRAVLEALSLVWVGAGFGDSS